jgi:hypothetical protein
MELSPSREAASCPATEKFADILWNPDVHYRDHNSPPLVHILSQINRAHTTQYYLPTIHLNIIFHLLPVLPNGLLLLLFPLKSYMYSCSSHECYMTCPSHLP